jgi:predicted ribosome quality control (RQC) complex YloA/Tae2 family protein
LTSGLLGIDRFLAAEILFRSKLSPETAVSGLSSAESHKLFLNLLFFFSDQVRVKPTVVLDDQENPCCLSAFDLGHVPDSRKLFFPDLNQALEQFFAIRKTRHQAERQRRDILNRLEKQLAKTTAALDRTLAEIEEKSAYQSYKNAGDLIMINKAGMKKGMAKVVLADLFSEQPKQRKIPLNPELSPLQNAQSYYKKYQRAKAGLVLLGKRKKYLTESLTRLENLRNAISRCHLADDLAKLQPQLAKLGLIRQPSQRRKKKEEKKAFREFLTSNGWTVLVGRNNQENDLLTFRTARPDDFWFHAANLPGSHVVLRKADKKSHPPQASILEAASIAAYFSKARQSKKVEVLYTQAKYVRKPQKAKPGLALVEREKSVLVPPQLPSRPYS